MAEYIEREAAIAEIMSEPPDAHYPHWYADKIKAIPAADVSPVRHGVWEYEPPTINTYGILKCSKCGWRTLAQSVCDVYHYCPNCGCKMDLEG